MKKAFIPLIVAVAIVLGVFIGKYFTEKNNQISKSFQKFSFKGSNGKLSDVLNIIEDSYVDDISADSLTEKVIPDIIAQLDPHSTYIPAKDLQLVNEELSGSFYGIGVEFNLQSDTVYIVKVIPNGPSEKVGILAGDKIVSVNDSVFTGKNMSNQKVMSVLRGDKNTNVKLGIIRKNNTQPVYFTVIRGEVPVKSVDVGYMITSNIGYISVNKFGETTYKEFLNALTRIKQQGAKSLIIDLRGNAGGYLGAAVEMLNEFLDKGDLIVYMQGAHQKRVNSFADGTGSFQNMKLAVLIDEFSGSASEIFSGAIQDNDRGIIIGRRSFGKGLVQRQIPLSDNSAIRITVARYYTPSGRSIQKPYTMGDSGDYDMDLIKRYKHGEFYTKDSIKENITEIYKTKGGRTVYGGGGIMPDIFVPSDTSGNSKYFNDLVNKGLTYKFALKYTDNNRNELSKFKDLFPLQKFLESQNIYSQIVKYGEQNGVFGKESDKIKSKNVITRQTIAYIIRNILDDKGFLPYFNQTDKAVQMAVRQLEQSQK